MSSLPEIPHDAFADSTENAAAPLPPARPVLEEAVPPVGDPPGAQRVVRLGIDDPRWLRFLESRPDATVFHHPAWSALVEECYGFTPFAACLLDGDSRVRAGLPVTEVRLLGRRRWVSVPYADAITVLADD
ncbi:MAG: hypothetical protein FJW96_17110, partial [Actinobacteria bacterium]|nr:hypothetical protein [Actinomycetota bacterium]